MGPTSREWTSGNYGYGRESRDWGASDDERRDTVTWLFDDTRASAIEPTAL